MKALEIILSLLDYFFRQWHQRQAQEERNDLANNPAGWFNEHFGGVPKTGDGKADKTDT